MFEKATPESLGIPSRAIEKFISFMERRGCYTHSLLLMRHEKICAESYYAPYDVTSLHRMYSQTKSFVSIAIGCLLEEGKLSLDDKIASHFPERFERELPPYLADQTIREMLTMTTSVYNEPFWFVSGDPDRVHFYLNTFDGARPAGTIWRYDSAGSQMLSALVEKLSGMPLLSYLKKRLFSHTGGFETAKMLKTPNGETWGDSAMLCTLRDIATFGNLVMHYGNHNGKQLMSESYLREATSPLVCNNTSGFYKVFRHGYGYQIWCTEQNGFAFVGMGDQLTVCLPERDFLFTMTADNQGDGGALREMMINALFDMVVAEMQDTPLPECPDDFASLEEAMKNKKLRFLPAGVMSDFLHKVSGKTFYAEENKLGIQKLSLTFGENGGTFDYENAQGEKSLPFGIGENVFATFPQFGYSDEFGGVRTTNGFQHPCATSLGFVEEKKCLLRMQIIGNYLGNFTATFAFKDEDTVTVHLEKTAEDFLQEYEGEFTAKA